DGWLGCGAPGGIPVLAQTLACAINELPAVSAKIAFLIFRVFDENSLAMAFGFSSKEAGEALTLHAGRCGQANELQYGRKQVDEFHQCGRGLAGLDAGRVAKEQWTAHGLFVTTMIIKPPMLSQQVAIIAEQNHQ